MPIEKEIVIVSAPPGAAFGTVTGGSAAVFVSAGLLSSTLARSGLASTGGSNFSFAMGAPAGGTGTDTVGAGFAGGAGGGSSATFDSGALASGVGGVNNERGDPAAGVAAVCVGAGDGTVIGGATAC